MPQRPPRTKNPNFYLPTPCRASISQSPLPTIPHASRRELPPKPVETDQPLELALQKQPVDALALGEDLLRDPLAGAYLPTLPHLGEGSLAQRVGQHIAGNLRNGSVLLHAGGDRNLFRAFLGLLGLDEGFVARFFFRRLGHILLT